MNMRTIRIAIPSLSLTPTRLTGAQLEDAFDDLVERAFGGDRRALGAIAIATSKPLLDAARAELGDFRHEREDVLQDFFVAALEGRLRFVRGEERASIALLRIIREMARARRADRERDFGIRRVDR
jgi:DNA-directed RNA polymerase specialized sigma24 family protein